MPRKRDAAVRCKDCRFYVEAYHKVSGSCHRRAPAAMDRLEFDPHSETNQIIRKTEWPEVNKGDRCGEFKRKEKT